MRPSSTTWTFLSNHGHVLICLARQPDARLRDVAELVGITERAVQPIVTDLEETGAITRIREGRRNRYEIHEDVRSDTRSHPTAHFASYSCAPRSTDGDAAADRGGREPDRAAGSARAGGP